MGREATGVGVGSETWGCDKPQEERMQDHCGDGSDKAEKSCGEQGRF